MILSKFQIIALVISLVWLLAIIELVRRKRLIGGYSLIWLLSGIALVIFALWEGLLDKITHIIGLVYPPSTFFALVIMFLVVILLDFSVKLSKISRQNKQLAQKIALDELKDQKNDGKKTKEE
jgi:hypothetical protein